MTVGLYMFHLLKKILGLSTIRRCLIITDLQDNFIGRQPTNSILSTSSNPHNLTSTLSQQMKSERKKKIMASKTIKI